MTNDLTRRDFLLRGCGSITAIWVSAHWPALLSAAKHARESTQSTAAPTFDFFSPEQAAEIDAITARIIPTDQTPGAHEAGVVYFIDRALTTFAVDDQKTYREGLPELHARVREIFPSLDKFSGATPEQQDQVLHSFDDEQQTGPTRPYRQNAAAKSFFDTLRRHTIIAFLLDPDAGGDPNGVGWKLIGRERQHMFQPPFGYYDKDYPGWRPYPEPTNKAGT
jgi:gluconate 2-dehydrogenase gamma chain